MDRALHVWLEFDMDVWCDWARNHGLTEATIEFARKNPKRMAPDDRTDLPNSVVITPSPRSMEFLGALYEPGMDRKMLKNIAQGLIGKTVTTDYLAHIAEYEAREGQLSGVGQLTVEHILTGNFAAPLAAEMSAGEAGAERVEATVRLMAADTLAKYKPDPKVAVHVAGFLRAVGQPLVRPCVEAIHQVSPEWMPLVQAAYRQKNAVLA